MPQTKSYATLSEAMSDVRHDYLVNGMQTKEIYAKYRPRCEKSFTRDSLYVLLCRSGMPSIKRQLQAERKEILKTERQRLKKKLVNSVEKREGPALALAVKEEAIERERKAQARHTKRMAKQADKAYGAIKDIRPKPETVHSFVNVLNDFDNLARKIYNMSENQAVSTQQFQIAVLMKQDGLSPKTVDAEVFEA